MIGVIPREGQLPLVEEFFELFKTPWELWRPDRAYDVVVATADDVPRGKVQARLLLAYGVHLEQIDSRSGFRRLARRHSGRVEYGQRSIPIYGELLTFERANAGVPIIRAGVAAAGLRLDSSGTTVVRIGYDPFEELHCLLSAGQPPELALVPTLDLHIMVMRELILGAGIPLVEVPAVPRGCRFFACLTHDIDFIGIRDHRFDHTMWGFLYRSTVGAIQDFWRARISARRLLTIWRAAASLPFVYLGWAKDFWNPFEWYLRVEKNLPATYFLIPFKRRAGERVDAPQRARRATAYDVTDIPGWTKSLLEQGCELGVHGIDAWHSAEKGRDELARLAAVTDDPHPGIRMHWLLRDGNTYRRLEEAGYAYDSSDGYNETIGFRNGTTQVFRPLGARTLVELPLHIQDGALFYPGRLDLSEQDAWPLCDAVIEHARRAGGVVTVLWHDRSHAPERCWGDFYVKLVQDLAASGAWFGTGAQVVAWFQKRRMLRFEARHAREGLSAVNLRCDGSAASQPGLIVRVHRPATDRVKPQPGAPPSTFDDLEWDGQSPLQILLHPNQPAITCALP